MIIDSFSGAAADFKPRQRTPENVLIALRKNPLISTWDMAEHAWLRGCLDSLKRDGKITEAAEPYPWHRFVVAQEQGESD